MKVAGVISKNTIVLHPSDGGQQINISKDTDRMLFAEVEDILNNGTEGELLDKYLDIKGKIERYSHKLFTVDQEAGKMYLKGDSQPMPDLIVEKLLELEKAGEDFMPLIRFWKKLKDNPSQKSIDQLYGFMVHNGIGLTESGDIVVEKGVKAVNGKLVDSWTGTMDNSIGARVYMKRELVDDNPEITCSRGLHVGAPEFVRQWYGTEILIKCTVNPVDVVSVPTDYNNTKMRVCEYRVVGYSDREDSHKPLFKLSDFVTIPNEEVQAKLNESKEEEEGTATEEDEFNPRDHYNDDEWDEEGVLDELEEEEVDEAEELRVEFELQAEEEIKGMTGPQILDYVEQETGVRMPYNPKSKSTIVKRGIEILANHKEAE